MKAKDSTMKLIVCVIAILSACGFAIAQGDAFQAVETEKIPDILMAISNQTKANFEQIHTWQGEMAGSRYFVDKGENAKKTFEILTDAIGPSPHEVAELTENKVTFKCDLDKGLFYAKRSREVPSRYIDPNNNRDLGTKSVPRSSIQILTKEYRYSAEPIVRRKGEVVQRKATKEKEDQSSCETYKGLQPAYLPTYIFDLDSQVWERYPDFVKIIKEKGEYIFNGLAMKVEQRTLSGDVQYRIHEPFTLNAFNINGWLINTFSVNAGYNMISSERIRADGKLMQKQSMEYQKINDVYVPIKNTEDTYNVRDFRLISHTESVFKNILINGDIPSETFTYKNLGLEDGDKFIDKVENKDFEYKDGELVELPREEKK